MTPIFAHEYTITSWNMEKIGIREIKILVVSETKEEQSFEAIEMALKFLDKNCRVYHKVVSEGYRND